MFSTTQTTIPAPVVGVPPTFPLNAFQIEFVAKLFQQKGQFMRVVWARDLKTRKGVTSTVRKIVVAVCRAGIEYDNRAIVQEKRAVGDLPAENQGLPWGNWLRYPYIIEHKGTLYVRLYPSVGSRAHAEYFLNGVSARREEIEPLCLASEFRDDDTPPDCFTVKLENIQKATLE